MFLIKHGEVDHSGKQYGDLTVIRAVGRDKNGLVWECKCFCGKTVERKGPYFLRAIKQNRYQSCKTCIQTRNRSKPAGETTWTLLFNRYTKNAAKRGLEFNLTKDEFKNICSRNCQYCNSPPRSHNRYQLRNGDHIMNVSRRGVQIAEIFASGIDRSNSNVGYILSNCIPCCHVCNYAKQTMTEQEFFAHIKRIYEFRNLTNFQKTDSTTFDFSHIFDQ